MSMDDFKQLPDYLAKALEQADKKLIEVVEQIVSDSFAAGQSAVPGSGHDATITALTAMAVRFGMLVVSRALEVHDDKPVQIVADVVTMNIRTGTLASLTKLAEGLAAAAQEKRG